MNIKLCCFFFSFQSFFPISKLSIRLHNFQKYALNKMNSTLCSCFDFSRLSFSNSILCPRFEAHFSFCWCFIYQLLYTQWTSLLFISFWMSFMWTAFLFTCSLSFSLHHWTFLFTVSMSLLLKFHLTLDFVQLHVGCMYSFML